MLNRCRAPPKKANSWRKCKGELGLLSLHNKEAGKLRLIRYRELEYTTKEGNKERSKSSPAKLLQDNWRPHKRKCTPRAQPRHLQPMIRIEAQK
jgi:hypothetical protein